MSEEEINVEQELNGEGSNSFPENSAGEIDDEAMFDEAVASVSGEAQGGKISEKSEEAGGGLEDDDGGADADAEKDESDAGGGGEKKDAAAGAGAETASGAGKYANAEWLSKHYGSEAAGVPAADAGGEEKPNAAMDKAAEGASEKNLATETSAVKDETAESGAGADTLETVASQIVEDAKKDPQIKEWMDAFPEDAKIFSRMAAMAAQRMVEKKAAGGGLDKTLESRLEALEAREAVIAQEERRAMESAWDREVEKDVPNWREIIREDKRFPEWFEKQSNLIKNCLSNASQPSDVVDALKKFNSDVGIQDKKLKNMRGLYSNPANERNAVRRVNNADKYDEDAIFDEASDFVQKHG